MGSIRQLRKKDEPRFVDEQDCWDDDPLFAVADDVGGVAVVILGAADTGDWSSVSLKGGEDWEQMFVAVHAMLWSLVPVAA